MLPGAVYSPFDMVPTGGLRLQDTLALDVLATVAVNCWVCPGPKETEGGLRETDIGGKSVTSALDDFVGSATLVAVTVTVWVLETVDGAVYRPLLERVPIAGFIVHVTLALANPVTVAENCWLCEPYSVAVGGLTAMDEPSTLTTAFELVIDPPSPFSRASTGLDS